MYFPTTCPTCQRENQAEFADSSVHDLTCDHCQTRYCVLLRKHKFEILFDLGTRALMDGYAREAVASFSAALERFLEFYVRAFALERAAGSALSFGASAERFEATWKQVVSQSERQMGMFALAYLLREGQAPEFLNAKAMGSDFRNKVIHRGYLPTREEVEDYAAQVFELIDRLLTQLGEAASQPELFQELDFQRHLAALPDDVIAVFEEHPGMFRARRFGRFASVDTAVHSYNLAARLPNPSAATKPAKVMNDARKYQKALFQQALEERGEGLKRFKGK